MANERYAIILAAGAGTRMKSSLHKILHTVCGKPMVQHVVDQARCLKMKRIVTVIGQGADQVQKQLGDNVEYAMQHQQLGTAHAVMKAKYLLEREAGTTIVLYGDTPLITSETIETLISQHEASAAKVTILTSVAEEPRGYGRIIRGEDGTIKRIVEEKDTTAEQKKIKEINTGIYCFDNHALFQALKQVGHHNAQGEYYLPDVIEILQSEGETVQSYQTENFGETLGINDRVQLAEAESLMRRRINEHHMRNGVTITDPDTVYIATDVEIGVDTVIDPGTVLSGNTVVGSDCVIGPHTEISGSTVGNGTVIQQSVVSDSWVGNDVKIGPFAHVRPASDIADRVKIGNFVEVKKSQLAEGSKAPHLSYVGDAEIGKNVNLGCGSITVNYDGQNKHLTKVEDGAFIGCNVNLVAPVTIGKDAFVAAGSTITDPVPEGALSIARTRQTTKENYARKLKQKGM